MSCERYYGRRARGPARPSGIGAKAQSSHQAEAIVDAGAMLSIDWRGLTRLVGSNRAAVRQWARKGTRPRQSKDQRYQSLYLFGAIYPARGTGAALAMP